MSIPPEPSKDEILLLRTTVLKKIEDEALADSIDQRDVSRIKNDNDYIRRFLMHHDNDQKMALDMAIDTLKWRKKSGANDITEDKLDKSLMDKAALFIHNRDVDGCKMIIFSVRKHFNKDPLYDAEKAKEILIYWIERLEREEKGKWVTVIFDMTDTGLKNMDMDFIQYMINLFKFYYPWILNYIIVFEMPWILNALWKIIKGWLPPKSLDKIKFVNKKTIQTYVPEDQCLTLWGGTDDYEFKFEPENKENVPANLSLTEADSKKVHFVESSSPVAKLSEARVDSVKQQGTAPDYSKISVEPMEKLMFDSNHTGTTAVITLTNNSSSRYAFKIKTTSPDKFRVRPSIGTLEPKSSMEVVVILTEQILPSVLVRDRFLVIAVPTTQDVTYQEFPDILKKTSNLDLCEFRLRVGMVNAESESSFVGNHVNDSQPASPVLLTKLDQIMTRQTVIEEQLGSLRRLLYVIFFLMVAILFVFVLTTNNLTSSILAHSRSAGSNFPSHVHDHPEL